MSSAAALALDEHVEVAVVGSHGGIRQFEFGLMAAAAAIDLHELPARIRPLRILVEVSCANASGCCRDRSGSLTSSPWLPSVPASPETLLQDRVLLVPQRHREAINVCLRSLMPARPSSFQRYARDRACSCGKYSQALPPAL